MSEARILVVGDMHFSDRSAFILPRMTAGILTCIDMYKPDHVVFLGDSLDRFGHDPARRTKQLEDFLYEVTTKVPCTVLIGNHDIENKNLFMSAVHHLNAMKYYWKNITIVDTVCVEFNVKGLTFQAVPYCPKGRLLDALNTLPTRIPNPSAIFCHQEIRNCNYNGITSTTGDIWPHTNPLLVCGHIHSTQYVAGDEQSLETNVYIPGSPYQDNHGEPIKPTKTISLMTFTQDSCKIKKISLNLPVKIKLAMTAEEFNTFEVNHNVIYWLSVTGKHSEISNLKYSEKTIAIRAIGGKVEFLTTYSYTPTDSLLVLNDKTDTVENIIAKSIQGDKDLCDLHTRIYAK